MVQRIVCVTIPPPPSLSICVSESSPPSNPLTIRALFFLCTPSLPLHPYSSSKNRVHEVWWIQWKRWEKSRRWKARKRDYTVLSCAMSLFGKIHSRQLERVVWIPSSSKMHIKLRPWDPTASRKGREWDPILHFKRALLFLTISHTDSPGVTLELKICIFKTQSKKYK